MKSRHVALSTVLSACLLISAWVTDPLWGQEQEDSPAPRPRLLTPSVSGQKQLVSDTQEPIIPPKTRPGWNASPPAPKPPFGTTLAAMPVSLQVEQDVAKVQLLTEPPRFVPESLPLLPSPLRQAMEEARSGENIFLLSGQVTVYRGQCYLLPTRALLLDKTPEQLRDSDARPGHATDPGASQEEAPIGEDPGQAGPAGADQTRADAEDIMARLLEKGTARPVVASEASEPAQEKSSQGRAIMDTTTDTRDQIIVNRLAYVVPEGRSGWRQVRFLSDNTLQKKPLRVLPNRVLDSIVSNRGALAQTQAYLISGDVMSYRGRRYLFLRKAVPKRDLGL